MTDVCILVEGAYPYVRGGISNWLHSLILSLPQLSFAIVHVGAQPDPTREMLYQFPANVVTYREIYINDLAQSAKPVKKQKHRPPSQWLDQDFFQLHARIALGLPGDMQEITALFRQPGFVGLNSYDLLHSDRIWSLLVKLYTHYAKHESFVDFFWTFRFTYLPIFTIFNALVPEATIYHAVSTGFCGLLGSLVKARTNAPFLLTEHGIYTREREIEIAQASWISQSEPTYRISKHRMSFFQEWWCNIYRFMEQMAYHYADTIVSITAVNQQYQLQRGAALDKLRIIPNGIDVSSLLNIRTSQSLIPHLRTFALTRDTSHPRLIQKETASKRLHNTTSLPEGDHQQTFSIGFVGRIVPVKDVKTFLRAVQLAQQVIKHLEVYLIGPTDEDRCYYSECCVLTDLLALTSCVHFVGTAEVRDYYRLLDLLVLTSLSEGQPLVVLEANCAGIPVIATDVGACRELLQGFSAEDQALGASGLLTPVASPAKTAEAIIHLWQNASLRLQMGRVGQERVKRFYRHEQLRLSYAQLYHETTMMTQPAIARSEKGGF